MMPAPPSHRQTIRPSMPSAGAAGLSSGAHTAGVSRGTASMGGMGTGASPVMLARINEKKQELENLRELKELSAQLAGQMEDLESKLETLSGGTESIALVLSNWHNVLRAISMASAAVPQSKEETENSTETPLPQTLVRIPVAQMDQARAKESGE